MNRKFIKKIIAASVGCALVAPASIVMTQQAKEVQAFDLFDLDDWFDLDDIYDFDDWFDYDDIYGYDYDDRFQYNDIYDFNLWD